MAVTDRQTIIAFKKLRILIEDWNAGVDAPPDSPIRL